MMELSILCLDDHPESLYEPLGTLFGGMLAEGKIPILEGGPAKPFSIKWFGDSVLKIQIASNSEVDPKLVLEELKTLEKPFDIVLVDDDWGAGARTDGQSIILPEAMRHIAGICNELPVFVLFTQHWKQLERVEMFCKLMIQYPNDKRRVTGLYKEDKSGLMYLIQSVVFEKGIAIERDQLRKRLVQDCRPKNMIGDSWEMEKIRENICDYSPSCATVLIQGESGTGKELVARAIHDASKRNTKNFVAVNIAAIPKTLLESELFGHERGAFTGALQQHIGLFEQANEGTLFLDEIGEASRRCQVRLLRVLQERQFRRVGGQADRKVDVRIIAATNKALEQCVREGTFREDLFYRLNVLPINMPPLRSRSSDIPLLVEHFKCKFMKEQNRESITVSLKAMEAIREHSWPGNVRELESCIESAMLKCRANQILFEDLPLSISEPQAREGAFKESKHFSAMAG